MKLKSKSCKMSSKSSFLYVHFIMQVFTKKCNFFLKCHFIANDVSQGFDVLFPVLLLILEQFVLKLCAIVHY